jgi:aminoglycoside phosphotransferase (APT) family kinase protein
VVVRLPALLAAYPDYDLAAQYAVQRCLHDSGVPVPEPLAYVEDTDFLGAPFLVMTLVPGHALDDMPAQDRWLTGLRAEQRRLVHEQYVDALVNLHAVDAAIAGLRKGLAAELGYWSSYLDWASDGAPGTRAGAALDWCAATAPAETGAVLLWGDARLGNAMYDRAGSLVALLDFELASIGPPEMDLGWYLALDAATAAFMGPLPDGLLDGATFRTRYGAKTGRAITGLAWHEIFALVRSVAISDRLAHLAATHGFGYPGVGGDANPMLDVVDRRIAAFDRAG